MAPRPSVPRMSCPATIPRLASAFAGAAAPLPKPEGGVEPGWTMVPEKSAVAPVRAGKGGGGAEGEAGRAAVSLTDAGAKASVGGGSVSVGAGRASVGAGNAWVGGGKASVAGVLDGTGKAAVGWGAAALERAALLEPTSVCCDPSL